MDIGEDIEGSMILCRRVAALGVACTLGPKLEGDSWLGGSFAEFGLLDRFDRTDSSGLLLELHSYLVTLEVHRNSCSIALGAWQLRR